MNRRKKKCKKGVRQTTIKLNLIQGIFFYIRTRFDIFFVVDVFIQSSIFLRSNGRFLFFHFKHPRFREQHQSRLHYIIALHYCTTLLHYIIALNLGFAYPLSRRSPRARALCFIKELFRVKVRGVRGYNEQHPQIKLLSLLNIS